MKGIKFQIEKLLSEVETMLLSPFNTQTRDIFDLNFYKLSCEGLHLSHLLIEECNEVDNSLRKMFTKMAKKIKEASKKRPESDSQDEQPNKYQSQELEALLNFRVNIPVNKQRGNLEYMLKQLESKQKDTANFLESFNYIKSRSSEKKKISEHIKKLNQATQTGIVWTKSTPTVEQEAQASMESLEKFFIPTRRKEYIKSQRNQEKQENKVQIKTYKNDNDFDDKEIESRTEEVMKKKKHPQKMMKKFTDSKGKEKIKKKMEDFAENKQNEKTEAKSEEKSLVRNEGIFTAVSPTSDIQRGKQINSNTFHSKISGIAKKQKCPPVSKGNSSHFSPHTQLNFHKTQEDKNESSIYQKLETDSIYLHEENMNHTNNGLTGFRQNDLLPSIQQSRQKNMRFSNENESLKELEESIMKGLDEKISQGQVQEKEKIIMNELRQQERKLLRKDKNLNPEKISLCITLMEKVHGRGCGKECKHLKRFYRYLRVTNLYSHRKVYLMPIKHIGFGSNQ